MSPEQGQGLEVGARSDIYALGVILYEMVVGEVPFSADTPLAVVLKHINQPLPLPHLKRPDLPDTVEKVILKALAKDPNDRFQTAGDMANALQRAIEGTTADSRETVAAAITERAERRRTEPIHQPPVSQKQRHWWAWASVTLVIVLTIGAALLALLNRNLLLNIATLPTDATTDSASWTLTLEPTRTNIPTPATPIAQALREIAARAGPGAQYPIVATLTTDETLDIGGVSEDGAWYQVLLPDGSQGWVAASAALVRTSGDLAAVPIVQAPSHTPTGTPNTQATAAAQATLDLQMTLSAAATATQMALDFQSTLTQRVSEMTATASVWTPTSVPPPTPLPSPIIPTSIAALPPLHNVGSPPSEALQVERCDSVEGGPGLCVKSLVGGGQLTKLVESPDFNPEQFPAGYSWRPDGKQIVFGARLGAAQWFSLYLIDAAGGELTERKGRYNPIEPSWSSDGQWWAFHDGNNLAVMHPDGTGYAILYPGHCVEYPQWSPDSSRIVFSESETTIMGCPHITPHTRLIIITSLDGTIFDLATTVHENACMDLRVAFSPDGQQIAYVDGWCQTMLINADGSGEPVPIKDFPVWWTSWVYPQWGREIPVIVNTPIPAEQGGKLVFCDRDVCFIDRQGQRTQLGLDKSYSFDRGLSWSPDGSRFVFSACSSDEAAETDCEGLYIANRDGSHVIPLVDDPTTLDLCPVWSPDGEWIAYHSSGYLKLVRPDGSELKTIVSVIHSDVGDPVWSPDSQRLAWTNAGEDPTAVWIANRDGTGLHLLFESKQVPLVYNMIAWSPDGKSVAVLSQTGTTYLIDASCSTYSTKCEDVTWSMIDFIPEDWLPNFYPQWSESK